MGRYQNKRRSVLRPSVWDRRRSMRPSFWDSAIREKRKSEIWKRNRKSSALLPQETDRDTRKPTLADTSTRGSRKCFEECQQVCTKYHDMCKSTSSTNQHRMMCAYLSMVCRFKCSQNACALLNDKNLAKILG